MHSINNKENIYTLKNKEKKYLHTSIIQPTQTHMIAEPFD